jgi:hypothetical protein
MTLAAFNCKVPVFHELLIDREEADAPSGFEEDAR